MFDHYIMNYLKTNQINTITIDELRTLALLKHKTRSIHLREKLWTSYYKAGKGEYQTEQCRNTTVNRCFWTKSIKKILLSKQMNINDNQKIQNQDKLYENFVVEHLEELQKNLENYQAEYNETICCTEGFTDQMEDIIDRFVEHYSLIPFQKKLNYRLALFECEYEDRILTREYLRFKPTDYQVRSSLFQK